MLKTKLLGATAAAEPVFIEDVFSTWLYTGNSSTQTITNGIDLAGEGGMVWIKSRSNADPHLVFDTDRGINKFLYTNATDAEQNKAGTLTSFNVDGFSLGSTNEGQNFSGLNYASWTFRKAPRFFDVVTYTGNGTNGRAIPHNLGCEVGTLIVKNTSQSDGWFVWHRNIANTEYLRLESTAGKATYNIWNNTTPTDSVFTVGSASEANGNGQSYVAYLFAHDPLGPSGDGSDGLIACGSFVGTGAEQEINLGYEPQFIIRKAASTTSGWTMFDNMRGFSQTNTAYLYPNTSGAESNYTGSDNDKPTTTGFKTTAGSGVTFIYIAIRRGPMREPTSGTEVFAPIAATASSGTKLTTNFAIDLQIHKYRDGAADIIAVDRLRGVSTTSTEVANYLVTSSTSAENTTNTRSLGWDNTGFKVPSWVGSLPDIFYNFRRAPGFMDCVAYSGTGSLRTVSHNLGAAPDLMIIKSRNGVRVWRVYCRNLTANAELSLNSTAAVSYTSANFNNTDPTDSVFTVNTNSAVNAATDNYIAYLFATLPGISKVGSYTGNGSNQTINCGFTGGARFVLIKRTDSTGDWYVWDTARGIVSGNDPHLSLNTTAAEVTTNDTIDPDNSGFIVNQVSATNVNVSSASYIYLAIA